MSTLLQKTKVQMAALGITPKKSLGQNFLISEKSVQRIVDEVKRLKPTQVIEIGPGLGALTEPLHENFAQLRVVELDSKFAQHWREQGLDVVEGDALQVEWTQNLSAGTVLVSNLPYQISSSLVIEMSLGPAELTHMVLMFQKEVAQRLVAKPKTEDYGLLSVVAQAAWQVRTLFEIGPRDFLPAPKVASRVVSFQRVASGPGMAAVLKVAKQAFQQRRKLLVKNLLPLLQKRQMERAELECELGRLGIDQTARAEELSVSQFLQLTQWLQKVGALGN